MRVLILSDIHANRTALQAVLAHAGACDATWCLGDLVGYGPDPNECVDCVRSLPNLTCLVGNHDKAALGEIPLEAFNLDARRAVEWTQNSLTPEARGYLASLPAKAGLGNFTLVHGSLREPVWEYVLDTHVASANFPLLTTPYCLVGHTHVPVIYREMPGRRLCDELPPTYYRPFALGDERLIVNPGSVGQPRDHNPLAAYAVLNLQAGTIEHRRSPYDITDVQSRMRKARLPSRLIGRLEAGW